MNDEVLLQTSGNRIVTRSGRPVTLRGVALGGWMNMESFITGHPATESLVRAALQRVLGEESCERFFDRWLDVFFDEDDAAFVAALGLNCVRVAVNYRHFEDDRAPFELKEEGFRLLDRVIDRCARNGVYTIIDLHALPGFQNQHWHCDNPTHRAFFWDHKHFQDRVVHLWEALASRYRDNPWVAGYNPINEPADVEGKTIGPFYARLHEAVRAIDPDHILFLDGNAYSKDFAAFREVWPNTVYACHFYPLAGHVAGGEYPGVSYGEYFDREAVERAFLTRTQYMRETGTPIWVGEFGPVYIGDERSLEMRYRLLADLLDLFAAHEASWSIWTYKDIGAMGLVHVDRGSAYMERIAPALEKKARLGADWWSSFDTGIRHIMGPIEEAFEHEFPDFEPLPGRQRWIDNLVRNILLAEPLVDEFAGCFAGASGDEAIALADSFKLDNCVRRERVLELLKSATSAARQREELSPR